MKSQFARLLILTLVLLLVTTLIPQQLTSTSDTAFAQAGTQGRVTTDELNVRAQPGTDSTIVGVFTLNTMIAVEGREDQLGNGGVWVFGAPAGGGTEGWVLAEFLQFPDGFNITTLPVINATGSGNGAPASDGGSDNAAVPAPAGALSGVTNNPVNFRTGPSTGTSIIQTLAAGTPVAVTGRNGNSTWYAVNVGGQEGWLYYTLVDVTGNVSGLEVVPGTEVPTGGGSGGGASNPPPVVSGGGLGGFSYGAHVQAFNRPDLMHYAGMTWAKHQVRYGVGQDPSSVAGLIADAHAKGFRVLLGVVGHPSDVAGGQGYFQQYANFVGGVAALGADAIEIWNEPNLDREWQQGMIDPALYTQLLALSYNAIKSNNPNTIVISAAPAPTGAEGAFGLDRVWNDNRYVAGMAAAGARNYMDCLGAHYNEGIVGPHQTSGDPRGGYYTRYFWGMVNTYRSLIPGKPICFTELGYLSPEGFGALSPNFAWAQNTSVTEQALWIDQVIAIARGSGTVRMVIIWNMDFQGSYGDDPMGGFALIRPDGTCPACNALAN